MQTKTDIRKTVLARRAGLSVFDMEQKSRQITEKITEHTRFLGANYLLTYVNFQSEVGTRELIEGAWSRGKRVFVPRVEGKEMEFYEIRRWEELSPGVWGIPEPKGDTCPFARIWEELQKERRREVLAIFPGVAFDGTRGRIGYGGGYYDRYFADKEGIFRIAPAFDLQVLEEVPTGSTDLRPDLVITESRTIGSEPPVDRTFGVREEEVRESFYVEAQRWAVEQAWEQRGLWEDIPKQAEE